MPKGAALTLEQIAALAGVSRATVSRVINDQPRVSSETRQRVLAIIRERGYHPNVAARSLASRRTQTIGLIIPSTMYASIGSPYYALIMHGVTTACEQRRYSLMLSPATMLTPQGYERIIHSGTVDGLVISTTSVGKQFLSWLHAEGFPFVLIGRQPDMPDINTVAADYEQGGAMAAQHLLWLGYNRIATITGPSDHGGAVGRRNGFLDTLSQAGRFCPDHYIVEAPFNMQAGQEAMRRLLAADPIPEAVFCASDEMAIGAIRAIHEAGLHVPSDIAVVGFDDIPMARSIEPPLTTVRQPIERMGFAATSMLIDILETRTLNSAMRLEPQHVILPTELVVRDSCGQKLRFQGQQPAMTTTPTVD
jgi:LacI family transcriptional regulator